MEVGTDAPISVEFLGNESSRFRGAAGRKRMVEMVRRGEDLKDFDRRMYEYFVDNTNLPYVP